MRGRYGCIVLALVCVGCARTMVPGDEEIRGVPAEPGTGDGEPGTGDGGPSTGSGGIAGASGNPGDDSDSPDPASGSVRTDPSQFTGWQPADAGAEHAGAEHAGAEDDGAEPQPVRPDGADVETEVWVGAVDSEDLDSCDQNAGAEGPLPMVVVLDRGADGTLLRASVLFGRGDPPSYRDARPLSSLNCEEAPFQGFEYPARQLSANGDSLWLGIRPLDVFAAYCQSQPAPSSASADLTRPEYECARVSRLGTSTPEDASLAYQLCANYCDCEGTGASCRIRETQTLGISLIQRGDEMEGFFGNSSIGIFVDRVRVLLKRVEP